MIECRVRGRGISKGDVWGANAVHIEFRSGQRVSWKSWVFAVVFMLVIAFGGSRGVTAAVVEELAAEIAGAGM